MKELIHRTGYKVDKEHEGTQVIVMESDLVKIEGEHQYFTTQINNLATRNRDYLFVNQQLVEKVEKLEKYIQVLEKQPIRSKSVIRRLRAQILERE